MSNKIEFTLRFFLCWMGAHIKLKSKGKAYITNFDEKDWKGLLIYREMKI